VGSILEELPDPFRSLGNEANDPVHVARRAFQFQELHAVTLPKEKVAGCAGMFGKEQQVVLGGEKEHFGFDGLETFGQGILPAYGEKLYGTSQVEKMVGIRDGGSA
jgi:hypothetical protein